MPILWKTIKFKMAPIGIRFMTSDLKKGMPRRCGFNSAPAARTPALNDNAASGGGGSQIAKA